MPGLVLCTTKETWVSFCLLLLAVLIPGLVLRPEHSLVWAMLVSFRARHWLSRNVNIFYWVVLLALVSLCVFFVVCISVPREYMVDSGASVEIQRFQGKRSSFSREKMLVIELAVDFLSACLLTYDLPKWSLSFFDLHRALIQVVLFCRSYNNLSKYSFLLSIFTHYGPLCFCCQRCLWKYTSGYFILVTC